MCLFTKDPIRMMMRNMSAMKMSRLVLLVPFLVLPGFLCSCAEQTSQAQNGQTQTGQTQSEYTNPGRPEVYSADERGYEKPWPFGDLANNPQQ
jgi:hypothetical protein